MNSKYKSKEFVLTLYISIFIIVLFYNLVIMGIEGYKLSSRNLTDYDSLEDLDFIYFTMFWLFCLIAYESLMFGWSLVLLKENQKEDRSKITFFLVLLNSSIPLILLLWMYLDFYH